MPNLLVAILAVLLVSTGESTAGEVPEGLGAPLLLIVMTVTAPWLIGVLLLRPHAGPGSPPEELENRLPALQRRSRFVTTGSAFLLFALALWSGGWFSLVESWIPPSVPGITRLLALLPLLAGILLGQLPLGRICPPVVGEPPSPLGSILHEARPLIVPVAPYLLVTSVLDLGWFFPGARERIATSPLLSSAGLLLALILVLLLSPLLVRFIYPSSRLSPGPLRERLEELARRAGVRYRDIRIWHTGSRPMINACIAGAIAPLRTIYLTDGIVRVLPEEELEGVFAHELGHGRHHHFLIYFALVIAFLFTLLTLEAPFALLLPLPPVLTLLIALLSFWLFFGILSRQLESQADLFGATLTGSSECFATALQRIGVLTGTLQRRSGLRHHSIPRRLEIIRRASSDPLYRGAFQRRTRALLITCGALLLLAAGAYGGHLVALAGRPSFEVKLERAHFLMASYDRGLHRPGRDLVRERFLLRRAEELLLAGEQEMRNEPELVARRRLVYRQLGRLYEILGERWDAAAARYFGGRPYR
ncbi:MAG: M48 family metalloprotease [Planctomycetota bacterium]